MIVLGIDPGVQRCGFAVMETDRSKVKLHEIGVWHLLKLAPVEKDRDRASVGARLEILHEESTKLFEKWNPSVIGLEKAVSFKNVASAHTLSEARGVIRLAAHQILSNAESRLFEMSPTAVKRQAAGWGQASKGGVLKMLSLRFENLNAFESESKLTFDAFDALAVAWTAWTEWKGTRGNW